MEGNENDAEAARDAADALKEMQRRIWASKEHEERKEAENEMKRRIRAAEEGLAASENAIKRRVQALKERVVAPLPSVARQGGSKRVRARPAHEEDEAEEPVVKQKKYRRSHIKGVVHLP